MRIIVAPDSYKGSLSALSVANAMKKGVLAIFPDAEVIKIPIADGGEGTVEALVSSTSGLVVHESVRGPLNNEVKSLWGILGDGTTAVVEMAAASGLTLVPQSERNPLITTSFGTGQLIKAALDRGIRKIIIGIGGSATNDGGAGMLQALGVRFTDGDGKDLPLGGAALAKLAAIDTKEIDGRLAQTDIMVACDVDNPLCGFKGASAVYGCQKGATIEMITELDAALKHYAKIATVTTGRNIAEYPGAGAAGGMGAGLLFFTNAKLCSGIDIVLDAVGFSELVKNADLVITGEGYTDWQTAFGKAPVGVASLAKKYNVPVVCLSGGLGQGNEAVLELGIDALQSIAPGPITLEESMLKAESLIEEAALRLCKLMCVGFKVMSPFMADSLKKRLDCSRLDK
jgi:glycerate kinase